jgi:alanyl-tRNA synthetase
MGNLYEKDPYKKKFRANLTSIEEKNSKYQVTLDKTYFYPEGGGQPSDKGKINGIDVNYVYKEKDKVIHIIDKKPSKEKDLTCEIDWERRYDLMQQHTGQHLLSAVFKNEYNLNTVGFNLSEESLRIDLDKQISREKIKEVEEKVNNYIYRNIEISTLYPSKETLNNLDLRKEPTVDNNIRVIKIGEIDKSPCGGTHLNSTGELGIIKIISTENYKGGLRISFVCGKRALEDYSFKNNIITELKDELSVPPLNLISEVKRYKSDLKESENEISALNKKLLEYQAEELKKSAELIDGIKVIKKYFEEKSYDDVQLLSDILCNENNMICIFAQKDENTARLLLSRSEGLSKINMNDIIDKPLEFIEGRGGGNKLKAQGGGNKVENINKALSTAENTIKNLIK